MELQDFIQIVFKQGDMVEREMQRTAELDAQDQAEQEQFIVNLGRV